MSPVLLHLLRMDGGNGISVCREEPISNLGRGKGGEGRRLKEEIMSVIVHALCVKVGARERGGEGACMVQKVQT